MAKLNINGKVHDVQVEADTPLLWVIREQVGLTGTKYGCGVAQCGACTVHVNGLPVRSCQLPVSAAGGARITTIEKQKAAETKRRSLLRQDLAATMTPVIAMPPRNHCASGGGGPFPRNMVMRPRTFGILCGLTIPSADTWLSPHKYLG